jgi:hypothetical protein
MGCKFSLKNCSNAYPWHKIHRFKSIESKTYADELKAKIASYGLEITNYLLIYKGN